MDIHKAYNKIDKLNRQDLNRCIRQLKSEIDSYKIIIVNYSEEKMRKCGTPYLQNKLNLLSEFESRLNRL